MTYYCVREHGLHERRHAELKELREGQYNIKNFYLLLAVTKIKDNSVMKVIQFWNALPTIL